MALQFNVEDDADREVARTIGRSTSKLWWQMLFLCLYTAVMAAVPTYFVKVSQSGELFLFGSIAFLWMVWLLDKICSNYYLEFRLRTKEIYGKVSVIEEAVNASKEEGAELLERLTAIEDKLDTMGN